MSNKDKVEGLVVSMFQRFAVCKQKEDFIDKFDKNKGLWDKSQQAAAARAINLVLSGKYKYVRDVGYEPYLVKIGSPADQELSRKDDDDGIKYMSIEELAKIEKSEGKKIYEEARAKVREVAKKSEKEISAKPVNIEYLAKKGTGTEDINIPNDTGKEEPEIDIEDDELPDGPDSDSELATLAKIHYYPKPGSGVKKKSFKEIAIELDIPVDKVRRLLNKPKS